MSDSPNQSETQPEILDLDKIVPRLKKIKLGGELYTQREHTVKDFVEATRKAQDIEAERVKEVERMKAEGLDPDNEMMPQDIFDHYVELILENFPTMTREILEGLHIGQLAAVITHVLSNDEREEDSKKKSRRRRKRTRTRSSSK